ncbi:MAG: NADH-quinone oxidoreductase subunit H [Peptostreptococcaceae bacterium]|nr:NADH-quinone oxidoreductase subunit H [Peptostreptococcaceae bacterium]
MNYYLFNILQGIILILLSPIFSGILKKMKAFMRGYKGPGVFQVYYDLVKLFNKETIRSGKSSFITEIGPLLAISISLTCAFMIPVFFCGASSLVGNLIVIVFLLGGIKLFNTLFGLDSSSTFGGMGTSRELFLSMLAEPVMFLIIMFLYFQYETFNIFEISAKNSLAISLSVGDILAFVSFFIVLVVENARLPIDNPETHLELTMIHEAMVLDLSGRDLALVELASMIKFTIFIAMIVNIFFPIGIATSLSLLLIAEAAILFLAKVFIILFVIAIIEVLIAKSRLFRAPDLIAVSFSLIIAAISFSRFIN